MNCPKCGKEMEQGWLQSGRNIFWSARKHKAVFLPNKGDGDVSACEGVIAAYLCAEYCRECGLFVARLPER